MEVSTLSGQGDLFIPYPRHYSKAFAFSTILYLLGYKDLSRDPASDRIFVI